MGKTYRRNDNGSFCKEGRFNIQRTNGAELAFDLDKLTSKDIARKNKQRQQQFNEDYCFGSDGWD